VSTADARRSSASVAVSMAFTVLAWAECLAIGAIVPGMIRTWEQAAARIREYAVLQMFPTVPARILRRPRHSGGPSLPSVALEL